MRSNSRVRRKEPSLYDQGYGEGYEGSPMRLHVHPLTFVDYELGHRHGRDVGIQENIEEDKTQKGKSAGSSGQLPLSCNEQDDRAGVLTPSGHQPAR
jgi:hypothetical protein